MSLSANNEFSFKSILSESRLDLRCSACHQSPQDPRILPCLHTLCRRCIERLAVADAPCVSDIKHGSRKIASVSPIRNRRSFPSSGYSSSSDVARGEETATPPHTTSQLVDFATRSVDPQVVICPACETQTALNGPPIQLPPNTLVTRFLDGTPGGPLGSRHGSASRQPASRSKRSSFCDLCTKTTSAVNRCIICVLSLCSFCTRAHRRQRKTNSHNLMSLQDSSGPTVGKDTEVPLQTYCPTHSKCVMNTFCRTCKKTACDQCILHEHKDHIQNDVNVAKEEELKRTSILLTRLRWKMSRMESSASGTLRNSLTLERNVSNITREVNLFYDGYVEALEARRRDLLEEIARFRRENENTLRTRKDSLDAALVKARQIHDFGKTLLHFGPEMPEVVLPLVVVLNKGAEPIVSDEGAIEDSSKTLRTLRFCKNGESSKGQYRIYGAVSSENWPSKTSAVLSLNAGSMARRENPVGVAHLEFRDSSGQPTSVEPEQVEAVLTSATSRRKTPVLVSRTARSGRLKLEFGYQNCGAHALTVTANGQQVLGSPFFFRLKPSQSSSCRLSGDLTAVKESESAVTLVRANEFDTKDSRVVPVGSAPGGESAVDAFWKCDAFMWSHSLLYTHKAWQFNDGVIECPVTDLEREDLVAQSIKEPFLEEPGRQRTAFAAARTRNTIVRLGEMCAETHFSRANNCVLASHRSGAPVTWLFISFVVCRSTFSFRQPLLVAICQALSV